jgi:hypothetical protein
MCDHAWEDAGKLYDYETGKFNPVPQCKKCKGARVSWDVFVRMKPNGTDWFVDGDKVIGGVRHSEFDEAKGG